MSNELLTVAWRARSVAGLDGWVTTGRAEAPRLLARRRFDGGGAVDTGSWPVSLRRATGTAAATYWTRIDSPTSEVVEQVATASGFHQHRVTIRRGFTALWATIDFRITARGADDRTRLIGLAHGRTTAIRLGLYARATAFDVWDHDLADTSAVAGGTFAVGDTWRRAVVYLQAATDAGSDGLCRVWLDGNTDPQAPDIETTHNHPLANQGLQFGPGSVDAAITFETAELAVYDRDPLALTPYSSGWAASPLFQEIVPALSAISLSPNPMGAQDGATAGTVIGQGQRTGGRGDGTWELSGDLLGIAAIDASTGEVTLTTAVDTATHDGTTGTISYTGDSAGGAAADITTSLAVTSATTSLSLSAASGGSQQNGTLDTSQPFQRLEMRWRNTPLMDTAFARDPAVDTAYAGTITRCGLEDATNRSNAVIIHVTSLDGGNGVGTLRWAAATGSDNQGTPIPDGAPVIVVFDVSGHIVLDDHLYVFKDNRWFAGQTAPGAANGSGGVFVHIGTGGQGAERRVRAKNVIIEHIRFVDGTAYHHSDGALDVWAEDEDLFHIMIRNCTFLWGTDETVSLMPRPGWRIDNTTIMSCLIAEPAREVSGDSSDRGFAAYWTRRSHRTEDCRNFWAGCRSRAPGVHELMSMALVNDYWYDPGSLFCRYVKHEWDGWSEEEGPKCHFTHVGNVGTFGPNTYRDIGYIIQHYNLPDFGVLGITQYYADEVIEGQPVTYEPRDNHTFVNDPPLWPRHNFLPHEDVEAYVLAHAGAWPGDRSATEQRIIDTWQSGGGLHYMVAEDRRGTANFPDALIQATTGQPPNLPANPFDVDANGLTVIENWLEQQHIARGGAPYQDFGRWLRFPWGGRVKVDTDGTATFDPVDMPAGESGTVEVTRADGSVVTVTCTAS